MLSRAAQIARTGTSRWACAAAPFSPARVCLSTSAGVADENMVIPTLAEVERTLKRSIDYPKIVVLGDQSSGKSSLVDALIGEDITHKGATMATRRPTVFTLKNVPSGRWFEFDDGERVYDLDQVRQRITRENSYMGEVSGEELRVMYCAPEVHNLTLIDLPGYIANATDEQDEDLPEQIVALCDGFVSNPDNINLVVISATEDPANSQSLRQLRRHNARGRSAGVLTKLDLKKSYASVAPMLLGEERPLGYGYFGVVLRSAVDLEGGVTIPQAMENEQAFFHDKGLDKKGFRVGIPTVRRELAEILVERVSPKLPNIIEQLKKIKDDLKHNQDFLVQLAKEEDMDTVARDLKHIIERLNRLAPERNTFEDQLRNKIQQAVLDRLERTFRHCFRSHGTMLSKHREVKNWRKSTAGSMLNDEHFDYGADLDLFTRTFMLPTPPDNIDNQILEQSKKDHVNSQLLGPYYKFQLPGKVIQARGDWNNALANTTQSMLQEAGADEDSSYFPNIIFKIVMEDLTGFLQNVDMGVMNNQEKTQLARRFGQFLFEKIGTRINDESMATAIANMVKMEQRAHMTPGQMILEVSQIHKHPRPNEFGGLLWDSNTVIDVPIYGADWTTGYLSIMAHRLGDNIFRVITAELLDELVLECLKYALNLFRSEQVTLEAEKLTETIEKLEGYIAILEAASDKYSQEG